MRVRRNSIVLLTLGGLLAAMSVALGVTQQVWGEQVDEAPALEELYVPSPSTPDPPPTSNVTLTPAAEDNLRKMIGKLYVEFPDGTSRTGTATVVTTEFSGSKGNGDLLITAGHLLNKGNQPATKVWFEPWVSGGPGPFGVWYGREWAVAQGSDIGMVLLYPRAGRHIQQVVGGQGLCLDCPKQAFVHVYGYSKDVAGGNDLDLHCQVNADFSAGPDRPYGPCLEGTRVLGDGAEGSAALVRVNPADGLGFLTAVHTGEFFSEAGWPIDQSAAFIDSSARELYHRLRVKQADPVKLTIKVTNRGGYDAVTTVTLPSGERITDCDIWHLAIHQSATRECNIPGGGSFQVHGEAVSMARKHTLTFPAVPSGVLCFTHYGTTFGFHLVNEACP